MRKYKRNGTLIDCERRYRLEKKAMIEKELQDKNLNIVERMILKHAIKSYNS